MGNACRSQESTSRIVKGDGQAEADGEVTSTVVIEDVNALLPQEKQAADDAQVAEDSSTTAPPSRDEPSTIAPLETDEQQVLSEVRCGEVALERVEEEQPVLDVQMEPNACQDQPGTQELSTDGIKPESAPTQPTVESEDQVQTSTKAIEAPKKRAVRRAMCMCGSKSKVLEDSDAEEKANEKPESPKAPEQSVPEESLDIAGGDGVVVGEKAQPHTPLEDSKGDAEALPKS